MKEEDYIDIDNFDADYAKHVYRLIASSHSVSYADSIAPKKYSVPPEIVEFLRMSSICKPYACRLSIKLRVPKFIDLYYTNTLEHLTYDDDFVFLDWVVFMMEIGYANSGLYYVNCNSDSANYGNIIMLSDFPPEYPDYKRFTNITEFIQCIVRWFSIPYENLPIKETADVAMRFLDNQYDYDGTFPRDYTIRQVLTSTPKNKKQKYSIEYNKKLVLKLMCSWFIDMVTDVSAKSSISLAYFIVHEKA